MPSGIRHCFMKDTELFNLGFKIGYISFGSEPDVHQSAIFDFESGFVYLAEIV